MKITNYVLTNLLISLEKYSEKKLPQRISYAIVKNMVSLSKEYSVYERQLQTLLKQYDSHIKKDEHGQIMTTQGGIPIVDDDASNEFNEQLGELLSIEIDVDMYYISEDVFDYDNNGIYDPLSAHDIVTLQSLLCKNE